MQKKLIVLAVAGAVSSVAFAQSNVTVYGIVDQAYLYRDINNGAGGHNTYSGIADGGATGFGSRFGLRGEEVLGNGLKAVFTMEYGRDADNETQTISSGGFGTRQEFVGLNSAKLGQVTLGRQYNAAADYYGQNSSNSVTGVYALNQLQGANGSQLRSQGGNARQDNMVKYISPVWAGFSMRANYSFAETGGQSAGYSGTWNPLVSGANLANASTVDNGRYAIAGDYTNGPFNIDLAYAGQSKVRTIYGANSTLANDQWGAQGKNVNEWYIGGGYDFKVVKLLGTYQQLKNGNRNINVIGEQKLWSLGAIIPVGAAGNVRVEYANLGTTQMSVPAGVTPLNGNSAGWALGYTHDLSKRTTLYTAYSQIKFDNDAYTTTTSSNVQTAGFQVPGQHSNNFQMGIRHLF